MTVLPSFTGIVRRGVGRGKGLGFPTANVEAPLDVSHGIHLGYVRLESKRLPALVFVGAAETFGETRRIAEVYVLNFEGNLYGKEIGVELLEKVRESKKFDSKEELLSVMNEDLRRALEYFKVSPCLPVL